MRFGAGVWHFALPDCVRTLFEKINVRESHRNIFSQKNQILIKKCRSKARVGNPRKKNTKYHKYCNFCEFLRVLSYI
ncbi:unnamed protein product [Oikopleura dioica]|uniref:Uncharacterized protein n=1 Tax=Oikopleura dioica TaxID=34765 RepID=E4XIX7_OIKDI|nr:unnamed protein product [Oikopleura dioica]